MRLGVVVVGGHRDQRGRETLDLMLRRCFSLISLWPGCEVQSSRTTCGEPSRSSTRISVSGSSLPNVVNSIQVGIQKFSMTSYSPDQATA